MRTRTQRELIDEIAGLYKTFDNVKEYYQASFFSDDKGVLIKYKSVINAEFYSKSRRQDPTARISVAKKAIRDYKKVSCSDMGLADIMVYYIETVIQYTNDYNVINESYYSSIISMYQQALEFIFKQELVDVFIGRLRDIKSAKDNMGWDYYDEILIDLYYRFIGED